jgi:hypothetical protein
MITRQHDTTIMKTRHHDSTMVITRQYDSDNTTICRVIIIVLSYCRVITIVLSRYHHRTVVLSSSYCRDFAFSSSYYRVSSIRSTPAKAMALTVFRSLGHVIKKESFLCLTGFELLCLHSVVVEFEWSYIATLCRCRNVNNIYPPECMLTSMIIWCWHTAKTEKLIVCFRQRSQNC